MTTSIDIGSDQIPSTSKDGCSERDIFGHKELGKKRRGRPRKRSRMGPASKTGRSPHSVTRTVSNKALKKYAPESSMHTEPAASSSQSTLQATEPRKFALRQKTSRSPIALLAMRQKMEDEDWNLQEATKLARALKRRQAHSHRQFALSDSEFIPPQCLPCCVVLVDFVKKLHLNQDNPDDMEDYVSDISYDSSEQEMTDEEEFYLQENDGDFEPQSGDADLPEDEKEIVFRKVGPPVKSSARKSPVKGYTPFKKKKDVPMAAEDGQETVISLSGGADPEPTPDQKLSSELANIKSSDFISNFIDFLNNKNQETLMPQARGASRGGWSYNRLPTPLATSPPTTAAELILCGLSSEGPSNTLSSATVETNNAAKDDVPIRLSIQPLSPAVETKTDKSACSVSALSSAEDSDPATVKMTQSCAGDEGVSKEQTTVLSSPTKPSLERAHTPVAVKTLTERGASPGKLKLFPRRESQSGLSDKISPTTRYICTTCKYAAYSKGTIESHVYIHIPGVAFKCGYCNTEFASLVSIQAHVKNSHNSKEVKVWISKDINEANFYKEEQIVPQVQQTEAPSSFGHDDETGMKGEISVHRQERFNSSPLGTLRRFACTHCSYSTDVKEDAQQHIRDIHQDSSLYTCCLCDKILGCSRAEVLSHCQATHPLAHRPSPFKKLPDFFDQELLQANSSSDRPKSTEDRGNIFDRMSSFLGPGLEVTEEGQLSPQARYVRARDYLYIQEGWCKKTSAEADSTTNEDIEMPLDDTADNGVDSTSEPAVPLGAGADCSVILTLKHPNTMSASCEDVSSEMSQNKNLLEPPETHQEPPQESEIEAAKQTMSGDAQLSQPGEQHPDSDDEDEANGDILVINLDEDEGLMLDGSGSHPSTPEEEKSLPSLSSGVESSTAKANIVAQDDICGGTTSEPKSVSSFSDVEKNVTEQEHGSLGIKIIEVVSLQGRSVEGYPQVSPAKSTSSQSSQGVTSPHRSASSTSCGASSESSGFKDSTSTPTATLVSRLTGCSNLPEVNADNIAARNERKVCTYKCHVCNVHSPQLQPIVEHLKQYHDDVPLFSCPYCKNKKDTFFKENDVHLHVSEKHPNNYAKNEVSLSELAKSFVQVISFLPGRGIRSVRNVQDIWMCRLCPDHFPDPEFALKHLKGTHPDVQLRYICPTCTLFQTSFQDVIKTHSRSMHNVEITEPLVPILEGVYFKRVVSISVGGLYVDHKPTALTPTAVNATTPIAGVIRPASTLVSSTLCTTTPCPTPCTTTPCTLVYGRPQQTRVPGFNRGKQYRLQESPSFERTASSGAFTQPRLILPMPTSEPSPVLTSETLRRPASDVFQRTGVTVRHMLEASVTKQTSPPASHKTMSSTDSAPLVLPQSWSPPCLTVNTVPATATACESLNPQGAFSTSDKTDRVGWFRPHVSPPASAARSPQLSRPVLRVPTVSGSHSLPALSIDTGTSCNTLPITAMLESSLVSHGSRRAASSLPFSVAALTSHATALSSVLAVSSPSAPATQLESDDPEAFKTFNLKPKTITVSNGVPMPQPAQPLLTPVSVATTTVTMASALFPQQFCVQQDIRTLPIGPGGLPLTSAVSLPIASPFQLNVGPLGTLSMTDVTALMKLQPGPLFLPAPLINMPLIPVAPAAHQQPPNTLPSFAINLPVSVCSTSSRTSSPHVGSPATVASLPAPEPRSSASRGRGRPRLNRSNPFVYQSLPGTLRSTVPRSPVMPVPLSAMALPQPQPAHSGNSPTSSVRATRHVSQQCQCPYCFLVLKPWEVAQHIKMHHPGLEIKYNRIN